MKKASRKKDLIKLNFSIGLATLGDAFFARPAGAVATSLGDIDPTPWGIAEWFKNASLGVASGVAFLLILYGGIKYLMSGGDFKAVDDAKKTITSALLGFLVVFLAVLILATIGGSSLLNIPGWDEFFTP